MKRERERGRERWSRVRQKQLYPHGHRFLPSFLLATFTNDDRNVLERGTIATLGIVDVSSIRAGMKSSKIKGKSRNKAKNINFLHWSSSPFLDLFNASRERKRIQKDKERGNLYLKRSNTNVSISAIDWEDLDALIQQRPIRWTLLIGSRKRLHNNANNRSCSYHIKLLRYEYFPTSGKQLLHIHIYRRSTKAKSLLWKMITDLLDY